MTNSEYTVVICGSFHKDPAGLAMLVHELKQTNCHILSPFTTAFLDTQANFTRAQNDERFSNVEIERFHLRALKEADIVWLFAPKGYIGVSASFELGYAHALQKSIFSLTAPSDEYIRAIVTVVPSVYAALRAKITS